MVVSNGHGKLKSEERKTKMNTTKTYIKYPGLELDETRRKAIEEIGKMLEDGLKPSFNELIIATRRFDENPHIATGAAKANAISEFHDAIANVSQAIYMKWQTKWADQIPSEEMSGLIHKASELVGFDDTTFMFMDGK